MVTGRISGGLLGHRSLWTNAAVDLRRAVREGASVSADPRVRDLQLPAMNAVMFHIPNDFAGWIAGRHNIRRRQRPMARICCLAEIDRDCALPPDLTDDAFVAASLDRWLA